MSEIIGRLAGYDYDILMAFPASLKEFNLSRNNDDM